MATTKLSATKSTSRAINYAEKRAVEKSGLNCDVDYAKSSFKASRELYGKTAARELTVKQMATKVMSLYKPLNQMKLHLNNVIS